MTQSSTPTGQPPADQIWGNSVILLIKSNAIAGPPADPDNVWKYYGSFDALKSYSPYPEHKIVSAHKVLSSPRYALAESSNYAQTAIIAHWTHDGHYCVLRRAHTMLSPHRLKVGTFLAVANPTHLKASASKHKSINEIWNLHRVLPVSQKHHAQRATDNGEEFTVITYNGVAFTVSAYE